MPDPDEAEEWAEVDLKPFVAKKPSGRIIQHLADVLVHSVVSSLRRTELANVYQLAFHV